MRRALASVLVCASLATSTVAAAQPTNPPRFRVVERPNTGLVAAGALMTGVSALCYAYVAYSVSQGRLTQDCNAGGSCGSGRSSEGLGIAVIGGTFLGVIGIPLLVIGFKSKTTKFEPLPEPHVAIVPTLGGLSVSGAF